MTRGEPQCRLFSSCLFKRRPDYCKLFQTGSKWSKVFQRPLYCSRLRGKRQFKDHTWRQIQFINIIKASKGSTAVHWTYFSPNKTDPLTKNSNIFYPGWKNYPCLRQSDHRIAPAWRCFGFLNQYYQVNTPKNITSGMVCLPQQLRPSSLCPSIPVSKVSMEVEGLLVKLMR